MDKLVEKLKTYKFTDELGHPLENCLDYQNIIAELEWAQKENEELLIKSLRLEKRDRIKISSRQIGKMRKTIAEFYKSLETQESVIMVAEKYVIMDNESYRKLNEKIRKLKIDMEFLKGAYDNSAQNP